MHPVRKDGILESMKDGPPLRRPDFFAPGSAVAVSVSLNDGTTATGELSVVERPRSERRRRAAKLLLFIWGAGLLLAFIPVIHLFAVPAALVAGPIAGFLALRKREALRGAILCPRGCATVTIDRCGTLPFWEICPICRATLVVSGDERAARSRLDIRLNEEARR